jgi:hypothetical protein
MPVNDRLRLSVEPHRIDPRARTSTRATRPIKTVATS